VFRGGKSHSETGKGSEHSNGPLYYTQFPKTYDSEKSRDNNRSEQGDAPGQERSNKIPDSASGEATTQRRGAEPV
jgi:hypothetical protein